MKDYPCFDKYFNSIEIFLSQGKQPRVTVPPFFPDNVKPFMSQADAEAFFEEINRIMMVKIIFFFDNLTK